MGNVTEKILLFLGGAAIGALTFIAVSKKDPANLRPALANLTAEALELRDKAASILHRSKEDLSDFIAEVEHARATKAEGQQAGAEGQETSAESPAAATKKTAGKK